MKFLKIFPGKTRDTLSEGDQLRLYRQNGDIRLLGSLYGPYMEMIYAVCYKYLKGEEESKDAVMQIFEKLIHDLRIHEIENFKSWLHSVARNHCLMQIRARHAFIAADEMQEDTGILISGADEADQEMFKDNQLSTLERCLETLSYEQKLAVELFYKQEKCYREISEVAGFDINKVKSFIQNGKRNLKICMDKNGTT